MSDTVLGQWQSKSPVTHSNLFSSFFSFVQSLDEAIAKKTEGRHNRNVWSSRRFQPSVCVSQGSTGLAYIAVENLHSYIVRKRVIMDKVLLGMRER
jgi:hypothetical protein